MSTAPIPLPRYRPVPALGPQAGLPENISGYAALRLVVPEHAQGLGILTHALEYLIDSRLLLNDSLRMDGEPDATQILLRLSRRLFQECCA